VTSAHVRDRVLAEAVGAFAEYGWRDSAVEEVCRRAAITSAEIYASWDIVDDLFVDMYRRETDRRVTAVRVVLEPLAQGRVDPGTAFAALVGISDDRGWWILTTEYELRAVRHPDVAGSFRDLHRRIRQVMTAVVGETLQSAGLMFRVSSTELVDLAMALHRGAVTKRLLEPPLSTSVALEEVLWTVLTLEMRVWPRSAMTRSDDLVAKCCGYRSYQQVVDIRYIVGQCCSGRGCGGRRSRPCACDSPPAVSAAAGSDTGRAPHGDTELSLEGKDRRDHRFGVLFGRVMTCLLDEEVRDVGAREAHRGSDLHAEPERSSYGQDGQVDR
jgi:AcrR family transcriptional regulator